MDSVTYRNVELLEEIGFKKLAKDVKVGRYTPLEAFRYLNTRKYLVDNKFKEIIEIAYNTNIMHTLSSYGLADRGFAINGNECKHYYFNGGTYKIEDCKKEDITYIRDAEKTYKILVTNYIYNI